MWATRTSSSLFYRSFNLRSCKDTTTANSISAFVCKNFFSSKAKKLSRHVFETSSGVFSKVLGNNTCSDSLANGKEYDRIKDVPESFRQKLKKAPVTPEIAKEIEFLRVGRSRNRRKKSDSLKQVSQRKDLLLKQMNLRPKLIVSAENSKEFPCDDGSNCREVVFAGRSNVGKSSLLNVLTGRRISAKVSATPGETRAIDFYNLKSNYNFSERKKYTSTSVLLPRFVDLPGYGFAYASSSVKKKWEELISYYFNNRSVLDTVCLVIDSRHGLKHADRITLERIDARLQGTRVLHHRNNNSLRAVKERSRLRVDVIVIMTKSDLVEQKTLAKMKWIVQQELDGFSRISSRISLVSSKSLAGISELREIIFGPKIIQKIKPLPNYQKSSTRKITTVLPRRGMKQSFQERRNSRKQNSKRSLREKSLRCEKQYYKEADDYGSVTGYSLNARKKRKMR